MRWYRDLIGSLANILFSCLAMELRAVVLQLKERRSSGAKSGFLKQEQFHDS